MTGQFKTVVALVPARGGSKGIPGKNLVMLAGKPLLAHTLASAREASRITRLVVSTEDPEIGRMARDSGAEVIERPLALATDHSPSEPALRHALDSLRQVGGSDPDLVVFLQATSPLRPPGAIDASIETLEREGADSLFSAAPVHGFVWREDSAGVHSLSYDHHDRPRRQDIGQDWLENGSIYVFKPWVLRETGNRLGGKIAVFPMDPLASFQVDEPGDLPLFEDLFAIRGSRVDSPPFELLSRIELLVLDFDGVLTDDRVLVDQGGREAVWCSRSDGMGIERLRSAGIEILVLSKESNAVVAARCGKLGISCIQDLGEKLPSLQAVASARGLEPEQLAYVGNDMNDVAPMSWVGVPIAVSDARPQARAAARWHTRAPGGRGAVREVCEWLLAARSHKEGR